MADLVKWFKYCRKGREAEYEALGWTITPALVGTHHGEWSTLAFIETDGEKPQAPPDDAV